MTSSFGAKIKQTAGEVADMLGEAAHTASERLNELREAQYLQAQIQSRQREKERCRQTMADLLVRMFDQNTFAEALLRPEYLRIKELDAEIAQLEDERQQVMGLHHEKLPAETEADAPAPAAPESAEPRE